MKKLQFVLFTLIFFGVTFSASAKDKPNILVIWGDDIGTANISHWNRGLMGYETPNIDRIAREGLSFTDYYGQQSCTAGRSAFITGQTPLRTGLTKVGLPGSKLGLQNEDPTIAELLKPQGYATGQFGKNHLGDQDKFLPTAHGFDEFFGNLYALGAEEQPEGDNYPKDPEFRKRFGPRGVIRSYADGRIEDLGPLTRKRMETIDDQTSAAALDFIERQHAAGKPFFVWWNGTRMHFRTYLKEASKGKSGQNFYGDAMVEHDGHVGLFLDKLDQLGISANTIVVYSTDNGPHYNTWPDAAVSPYRSEKNTNWEGAYRVPAYVRWPGKFPSGKSLNGIVAHEDWLPTLLTTAGVTDIQKKLKTGYQAGSRKYKVHLDGYNMLPYFMGQVGQSPRDTFWYITDDGSIAAVRYEDWKVVFLEQRAKAGAVWMEPFVPLRAPKLFNLRWDPYERADQESNTYFDWVLSNNFIYAPIQALGAEFLSTFKEFPPRQKPGSFNLDRVMENLTKTGH